MLETLNRYIDEPASQSPIAALARNRRFGGLLALSIVGHLLFFAFLVRLNWVMRFDAQGGRRSVELVQIAEIAPPPDRHYKLRPPPEAIERADLNRLQFDPERNDDVHLSSRSPAAAPPRKSGGPLPSAQQIEQGIRASRASAGSLTPRRGQRPPAIQPLETARPAPSDAPVMAQMPAHAAPLPPAPSGNPNPSPPTGGSQQPAQGQARQEQGTEPAALGLQVVMGQFQAYVRAKIRKINERIMPRSWIETMLDDKVSAEFGVVLRRGGQIASLNLLRSTGHPTLDATARQAIFSASPFEGYPQAASDTIQLTVTVYYTPYR